MGIDQTLPVFGKDIFAAVKGCIHAASTFCRFNTDMCLCIMTQGFKMSDTDHRLGDCLFIEDLTVVKGWHNTTTVFNQLSQNLNLNRPHQHNLDCFSRFVPCQMQLWKFFIEIFYFCIHQTCADSFVKGDRIGNHRLDARHRVITVIADAVPCLCGFQPRNTADMSCGYGWNGLIMFPIIDPDLCNLLCPDRIPDR